jgi:hypothetical protein
MKNRKNEEGPSPKIAAPSPNNGRAYASSASRRADGNTEIFDAFRGNEIRLMSINFASDADWHRPGEYRVKLGIRVACVAEPSSQ